MHLLTIQQITPYWILSKKVKFENLLLTENLRINCYLIIHWIRSSSKTLFCLEFKSHGNAKGTSISGFQNIKIKGDNYNVYTHSSKTNINIFGSLALNRSCGNFKLWLSRGRRGIVVKYMPHVQHAYFSLFNQYDS